MRLPEASESLERTTITLRWAMLLATAILAPIGGPLPPESFLALIFLFVLQVVLSISSYINLRLPRLSWIGIALLDALLILPVYLRAGGGAGAVFWIGLLPAATFSIFFGSIWGVLTGCFMAAAQVFLQLSPENITPAVFALVWSVPLMIIAGGAGNLAQRLDYRLMLARRKRDEEFNQELDRLKTMNRSVYRMASAITGSLEPLRILDTALDLATEGSGEKGSTGRLISMALLRDQNEFFTATARRLTRADLRATFPGDAGALSRILRSRMPTRADSPEEDPELSQVVTLHACRSGILLPMVVEDEVRGALLFAHPDPRFIEGDFLELVEGMTKQTASSLRNAELFTALREERDRLVEVEEQARKKLASDLHDGPIQATAAIAMRVNYARRLLQRRPETTSEELFEIEELARRATKEMRHMLFTLRPLVLETQGLATALRQLAEKTRDTFNQEILLDLEPDAADKLDINRQGVLFNLVDEAIGNARKHAKAAHIWIRMHKEVDVLFLEVADDGVGFDLAEVEKHYTERSSLGLVNLRERAELAGGNLQILSAPGKGTRVQVRVPLQLLASAEPSAPKA
ncbi:MAG: GAF domain-containing protein [Anaerolineales bacterium]|nr:GAF domain-containing protein [Anaerolineales bacterium]